MKKRKTIRMHRLYREKMLTYDILSGIIAFRVLPTVYQCMNVKNCKAAPYSEEVSWFSAASYANH